MSPSFELERPLLQGLAYRMLGTVDEAEEVVTETLLRWHALGAPPPRPDRWLLGVCLRVSIEALRAARVRRESYVGPWIPEPLVGMEATVAWGEFRAPMGALEGLVQGPGAGRGAAPGESLTRPCLSLGFLLLLEELTPGERAAVLLRTLYGVKARGMAELLQRTEGACRTLLARGRLRLEEEGTPAVASVDTRDALLERFLLANATATLEPLESVFSPEVQLWSDGGGVVPAALRIIESPERVARFLLGMASRARLGTTLVRGVINGDPGLLVLERGRVSTTLSVVPAQDGRIERVLMVRNPAKLGRARLPGPPPSALDAPGPFNWTPPAG